MRKPAVAMFLCLAAVVLFAVPGFAKLETAKMTTAAVIEDAFNRGDLSHEEMILQKAYAVYAPWKLREDLTGGLVDKCGTPYDDEIRLALPNLSEPVAAEIRGLRARPSTQTYIDTQHFRIHYDTSGTHSILSTAYRDAIMAAAENVWAEEIGTMGFRQPPPDGNDPDGGGGNNLYDIYVQELGAGLYGYCQGSYYYSGPGYPSNAATSYVVIDNNYPYSQFGYPDPVDPMKVTVAHEFNHAIQAAHDINESTWYKEATSTWIEDIIYDDVNDYRNYLSQFLNSLYQSINYHNGSLRWYGACVWNFFLAENFGNQIVVDNWYQMEGSSPTLTMLDIVLGTYGSSMEEAYFDFAKWCWFTGFRDDGNHFEEGGEWYSASIMRGHSTYPIAIGGPTPGWEPDDYGCNYISFNYGGSGYSSLLVSYDGPQPATTPNACFLNYRTSGGTFGEYGEIPLNGFGVGELTFSGWNNMSYVGLVVANCSSGTSNMSYSYNAEEVETGVGEETFAFGLKAASPNPFTETTAIAYSVPTGGGFVDIVVYDVNGREVRSLVHEQMGGGAGRAVWDGLDNAGERVASGVYFARLDIDGLTASGKLMMLK
jgi:hypothetical protein